MIENINDFISVLLLVGMIGAGVYGTYKVFVRHHEHRMQKLESEYYQSDGDDTKSNFY